MDVRVMYAGRRPADFFVNECVMNEVSADFNSQP